MSDELKIFVDGHCFDKEYQGTRTFVKEIYSVLSRKKDLRLFIAAYDLEELRKNFPEPGNIVFIKYRNSSAFMRLAFDIPSIIKTNRIDFAHFQYITPLRKNCRQIVTIHDVIFSEYPAEFSYFYRVFKKFLYRRSARKADVLTTVSDYSLRSIRIYLQEKIKNIAVIPNGVSQDFFKPDNKTAAKKYIQEQYGIAKFILYVSRIEPRKNHFLLLKAWLELNLYKENYYLVLLGHQTMKVPAFDQLLMDLPAIARDHIFISDHINDEALLQFYNAADLFVYPSKAEGFGIPPLEAAATKIPVLCSNSSAMEAFSFFGNGHFDPNNYLEFKNKLSSAVTKKRDEAFLENLSETIRKEYSWNESAEKLYQLIIHD